MVSTTWALGCGAHGTGLSVPGTARQKPSRSPVSTWRPVSITSRPQVSMPNIESGKFTPLENVFSMVVAGAHLPRRMPLVSVIRSSAASVSG